MFMTIFCEICMELITSIQDIKVTTCGHLFHSHCVLQWIDHQGHDSCPHCRNPQSSYNLIRVFLTSAVNEDCNVKQLEEDLELATSTLVTLKINVDRLGQENEELIQEIEELKLKLISMEYLYAKTWDESIESELKLSSALNELEEKEKDLEELKLIILSLQVLNVQECSKSKLKLSLALNEIAKKEKDLEKSNLIISSLQDRQDNVIGNEELAEPIRFLEASSSHNYRKRYNNKTNFNDKSVNENKQPFQYLSAIPEAHYVRTIF